MKKYVLEIPIFEIIQNGRKKNHQNYKPKYFQNLFNKLKEIIINDEKKMNKVIKLNGIHFGAFIHFPRRPLPKVSVAHNYDN